MIMENSTVNETDMAYTGDGNQTAEIIYTSFNRPLVLFGYLAVTIGTVVGNLMVIVAFLRFKDVRAIPTNIIILSLAISDFLVGAVCFPLNLSARYAGGWMFGETVCRIWSTIDYGIYFVSIISIMIISFDRFLLVTTKSRYRTVWSHRRVSVVCGASWLISFACSLTMSFGMRHLELVDFEHECELEFVYMVEYFFAMLALSFVVPFILITLLNGVVYAEIYRRSKGVVRIKVEPRTNGDGCSGNTLSTNVTQVDNVDLLVENKASTFHGEGHPDPKGPGSTTGGVVAAANSGQGCGAQTSSGQKTDTVKKQYSKHRKAAITLSILVGTFVVCWMPFHIIGIVQASCGGDECFSEILWEITCGLQWGNSMLNPILYGLTNPLLRRRMLASFRPTRVVGHS